MAKSKQASKTVSGLSIARKGYKFTCTWKIPSKVEYGSLKLEWEIQRYNKKTDKWYWQNQGKVSLGKKATSKVLELKKDKNYPTPKKPRASGIRFRIHCNQKDTKKKEYTPKATSWKVFDLKVPSKPKVSQALRTYNSTIFSWSASETDTGKEHLTNVQIARYAGKGKGALNLNKHKKDFTTYKDSKGNAVLKGVSSSIPITEDSLIEQINTNTGAGYCYVRWFAARAVGPAGYSDWVYTKHVYAPPARAVIKKVSAGLNKANGTNCNIRWAADVAGGTRPIDRTEVQYCIEKPINSSLTCPSGATWTVPPNGVVTDTKGNDACSFKIDDKLKPDECLYFRVVTYHDNIPERSIISRVNVNGKKPTLAKPSGLSVENIDLSTYRATISAKNNSEIPGTILAVMFKRNSQSNVVIGYMSEGVETITAQLPQFSSSDNITISVKAVALASKITAIKMGTYTRYSFSTNAESDVLTDNGNVPKPPGNFRLSRIENRAVPGTFLTDCMRATWSWTWLKARDIELSWSDHEDAWESTNEPDSYKVSNTRPSGWNIADLMPGQTYHARARFIASIGEEETTGPWSNTVSISLSESPSRPSLTINPGVVSINENFVASWVYVSNDTTNQSNAEVCVVEVRDGEVTKYTNVKQTVTGTNQRLSINPRDLGFQTGNSYYLCVRVNSTSGQLSEWSLPVQISIAELPSISFSRTSLIETDNPVEETTEELFNIEPIGDTEEVVINTQSSSVNVGRNINSLTEISYREANSYNETISLTHIEEYDLEPGETEIDPKYDIGTITSIDRYSPLEEDAEFDSEISYYIVDTINGGYIVDSTITETNFEENKDRLYIKEPFIDYTYTKETITLNDPTNNFANFVVNYIESKNAISVDGEIFDVISLRLNGTEVSDYTIESSSIIFPSNFSNGDTVSVNYYLSPISYLEPTDYTFSGNTISFNSTYPANTFFRISYNFISNIIETASNISSISIIMSGSTEIRDYTYSGNKITINDAIESGAVIQVVYLPDLTIKELTLTKLPLTASITTNVSTPIVRYMITRNEAYHLDRPDESTITGYMDEVVVNYTPSSGTDLELDNKGVKEDGSVLEPIQKFALDDGAEYKLTAYVTDSVGQSNHDDIIFRVRWEHQAAIPEATFEIYEDEGVTAITPIAPNGVDTTGDYCDIYRLSVDKPELIYEHANFGTTYIDPYPTIGEYGGHRIVYITANGDYITPEDEIAFIDLDEEEGNIFNSEYQIIDFGSDRVNFLYNVDLSSSWSKDFKETKYLGGHVQGDWNPAVSRTGSINTVMLTTADQDMIKAMRRLAVYSGICHIRTRDGSSYAANIDVSESLNYQPYELASYSLNITRVDSDSLDGMTLTEWRELHPIE